MCLVVLLTPDVAHEVDASEPAADKADGQLAELQREDARDGEDDPHDGHGVRGHPEHEGVSLVHFSGFPKGLEVPCLFAILIDFAPPAEPDQNPTAQPPSAQ